MGWHRINEKGRVYRLHLDDEGRVTAAERRDPEPLTAPKNVRPDATWSPLPTHSKLVQRLAGTIQRA